METKIRSGYRKVHRHEGIWQYKINGCWNIFLYSPKNNKTTISMSDFTGIPSDVIDRNADKGHYPAIGPGDIDKYIDKLPLDK